MSTTKERRNSYSYRDKYVKHNPGVFGGNYRCSICHKSLTKEEMEVDHIIPLNKYGPNHIINCVAACHDCNAKKSDHLTKDAIYQILWKLLEETIIFLKWIFKYIFEFVHSNFSKLITYNIFTLDLKLFEIDITVGKLLALLVIIFLVGGKLC